MRADLKDSATEVVGPGAPVAEPQLTMEQVSESIWRLTEEVLELLRTQATSEIQRSKSPDVLWVDDVTRSQGKTVIAVRQLSEAYPEGVTLKKLAETIGVTPAAASVMVDLLVKKRMLKRTRSKSDRRSILIRLAPETSRLFETSEQSLRRSVMSLLDLLGPETLREWQRNLVVAAVALRQVVQVTITTDPWLSGSPSADDEGPSHDGGPSEEPDGDVTAQPEAAHAPLQASGGRTL